MTDVVIVEVGSLESVVVDAGFQGPPGVSAYQIAVANGFGGSETEWLASLVGFSGAVYQHQQPTASATWVINHNFGRYASVALFSLGGAKIIGDITNININQSVAGFDSPIAGYAIAT